MQIWFESTCEKLVQRRVLSVTAVALLFALSSIAAVGFCQEQEPGKLRLVSGDRELLTYNAELLASPQEDAPWYGRSGFIHPFLTPSGQPVTEAFPADHMHQHGLMFAWTSAVVDGEKVDFWNSHQRQGHIQHDSIVSQANDRLVVRLRHINDLADPPQEVLSEEWQMTAVTNPDLNVFDLVSTQKCLLDSPLQIAKYHYGAMCIRGPASWLGASRMVTSEGESQKTGNHSRPRWVAMLSNTEPVVGVVAMSHPSNFRSPQHVRLHPTKPYFCFLPMVESAFEIASGATYVSRFRFVAFDGELDRDKVEEVWQDFSADAESPFDSAP